MHSQSYKELEDEQVIQRDFLNNSPKGSWFILKCRDCKLTMDDTQSSRKAKGFLDTHKNHSTWVARF
jgi:hypothetical protein